MAAILEDRLTAVLRLLMRRDKTIANDLFKPTGPLGPFETKIRVAYMLFIIDETTYKDLIVVSKIRNKFAHDLSVKTFEDDQIAEWVKSMHVYSIVKRMAEESEIRIKAGEPVDAFHLVKQHALLSTKDSYRQGLRFMIHHIIDFQIDIETAESGLNTN